MQLKHKSVLLKWHPVLIQYTVKGDCVCLDVIKTKRNKLSKKKHPNPFPKISVLIRNKLHTALFSSLLLPPHTHSTLYLQQICISIYSKLLGEKTCYTGLSLKMCSLEMLQTTNLQQYFFL